MTLDTRVLAELLALRGDVKRLAARLDAVSPSPWPDRLSTAEAVAYVRQAYARPRFTAGTLRRWRREGRLTAIVRPPRWLRPEIDRCCGGTPVARFFGSARGPSALRPRRAA